MVRTAVLASLALLLLAVETATAADAVISVSEVEVRSGPSQTYYATGKLSLGDRVQVLEEKNGFLAITPPPGSFSLVPKEVLDAKENGDGVVAKDAHAFVGSSLSLDHNVRGAKLNRGIIVRILGEVPAGEDGVAYYKIQPSDEPRYIPADAVEKKREIVQTAGAAGATFDGPVASQLKQADEAYRKAQETGDWTEAKRLYEELVKCSDHEARMVAWNRLMFMQKRGPVVYTTAPGARANSIPGSYQTARSYSPGTSVYTPPAPKMTSSYAYTTDTGPAKLVPLRQAPAAPAAAAPTSQSRYVPPATTEVQSTGQGRLRRSARSLADGRQLYLLEDSRGNLRCYVAPTHGLNLEPFLNQVVELYGEPMMYHSGLRGNYVTATQVSVVGN